MREIWLIRFWLAFCVIATTVFMSYAFGPLAPWWFVLPVASLVAYLLDRWMLAVKKRMEDGE